MPSLVLKSPNLLTRMAGRLKIFLSESLTYSNDYLAASKSMALMFYTFLSMTPLLVLAVAVAGFAFDTEAAQSEIIVKIHGLIGSQGEQAIQALLATLRDSSSGLAVVIVASVLLLLMPLVSSRS